MSEEDSIETYGVHIKITVKLDDANDGRKKPDIFLHVFTLRSTHQGRDRPVKTR